MNEQNSGQTSAPQRPTTNDPEAWRAFWNAQGQPWRSEPEIETERQQYLAERRAIVPDIEKGVYPFKGIEPKLIRADVEWLLATHENGRGPVNWNDESQREREGLDLRGADLRQADLRELPLTNLIGGIDYYENKQVTEKHIQEAAVLLEGGILTEVQLQGANLAEAQLKDANFFRAQLEKTNFRGAQLEGANFVDANLQNAILMQTSLEGSNFNRAQLKGADIRGAILTKASFIEARLEGANLYWAKLEETNLANAVLSDHQDVGPIFADVQWGNTNLSLVDWSQIKILGDDHLALKTKALVDYKASVRANRQLAVALQNQGLNEEASRFAYRAQLHQRVVLRLQKKFGQYFFSLLLDLLAGYGFRPGRSVLWYLAVIFGFALTYFTIGNLPFFPDAFVFSLTSFHGRGFFPGLGSENSLHNPLVVIAAFEAVIGLLIEISFIATFTQRFFGR